MMAGTISGFDVFLCGLLLPIHVTVEMKRSTEQGNICELDCVAANLDASFAASLAGPASGIAISLFLWNMTGVDCACFFELGQACVKHDG
jgi:hypothetical protein